MIRVVSYTDRFFLSFLLYTPLRAVSMWQSVTVLNSRDVVIRGLRSVDSEL